MEYGYVDHTSYMKTKGQKYCQSFVSLIHKNLSESKLPILIVISHWTDFKKIKLSNNLHIHKKRFLLDDLYVFFYQFVHAI